MRQFPYMAGRTVVHSALSGTTGRFGCRSQVSSPSSGEVGSLLIPACTCSRSQSHLIPVLRPARNPTSSPPFVPLAIPPYPPPSSRSQSHLIPTRVESYAITILHAISDVDVCDRSTGLGDLSLGIDEDAGEGPGIELTCTCTYAHMHMWD